MKMNVNSIARQPLLAQLLADLRTDHLCAPQLQRSDRPLCSASMHRRCRPMLTSLARHAALETDHDVARGAEVSAPARAGKPAVRNGVARLVQDRPNRGNCNLYGTRHR